MLQDLVTVVEGLAVDEENGDGTLPGNDRASPFTSNPREVSA